MGERHSASACLVNETRGSAFLRFLILFKGVPDLGAYLLLGWSYILIPLHLYTLIPSRRQVRSGHPPPVSTGPSRHCCLARLYKGVDNFGYQMGRSRTYRVSRPDRDRTPEEEAARSEMIEDLSNKIERMRQEVATLTVFGRTF
jgi:hypothetical protein